jgi:hypothetical protein
LVNDHREEQVMASDDTNSGSSEPAKAENPPEQGKTDAKTDPVSALPEVESPSISPAESKPATEPVIEPPAASTAILVLPAPKATHSETSPPPRLRLTARHKRYGLLAASVALAAAFGAVIGALASGGLAASKPTEIARVDDNKTMQQTVARLTKDIATLKANVEAANKTAHAQFAKISDKLSEKIARDSAEITGSIAAPQTAAAQPAPTVPVPLPRPAQGHGRIFEVAIGTQLPGLGRVEQVKRQDGRWTVVTPKGVILSMSDRPTRDRRYFE